MCGKPFPVWGSHNTVLDTAVGITVDFVGARPRF